MHRLTLRFLTILFLLLTLAFIVPATYTHATNVPLTENHHIHKTSGIIIPFAPASAPIILSETEPNNLPAVANVIIGTQVWYQGSISPLLDADYFAFSALAGDRVYAATQTAFGLTTASQDSVLDIFASNGITVLENDDENGTISESSSAIAGMVIPTTGTYYIRVTESGNNSTIQPYYLHFQLKRGSPTPETEPNNDSGTATPLASSGWMAGTIATAGDIDVFSVNLEAGESVYLGLDLASIRPGTGWNGSVGLGLFTNQGVQEYFFVDDSATIAPNAEAFFYTVRTAGTYYIRVTGGSTGTATGAYHLSVTRDAAFAQSCTTYTSTNVPLPLGPNIATVTDSTLLVPSTTPIQDINVNLNLNHGRMIDMDVQLVAPGATTVDLFTDVGANSLGILDNIEVSLDDQSARPVLEGLDMIGAIFQPEPPGRLSTFNGLNPSGTWTLRLTDDDNGQSGTLLGWSIELCNAPLAVTLNSFEAQCRPQSIEVMWETASETGLLGFNLYRATTPDSTGEPINNELILSQSPGGGQGATYVYDDSTVSHDTYYYWLEAVDNTGTSQRFGPTSATYPCVPTTITLQHFSDGQQGTTGLWTFIMVGVMVGLVGYRGLRYRKAPRS